MDLNISKVLSVDATKRKSWKAEPVMNDEELDEELNDYLNRLSQNKPNDPSPTTGTYLKSTRPSVLDELESDIEEEIIISPTLPEAKPLSQQLSPTLPEAKPVSQQVSPAIRSASVDSLKQRSRSASSPLAPNNRSPSKSSLKSSEIHIPWDSPTIGKLPQRPSSLNLLSAEEIEDFKSIHSKPEPARKQSYIKENPLNHPESPKQHLKNTEFSQKPPIQTHHDHHHAPYYPVIHICQECMRSAFPPGSNAFCQGNMNGSLYSQNYPMNQPMHYPMNQPMHYPMNQPMNNPMNQMMNQPMMQYSTMNQPINTTTQTINQPIHPTVNSINQPTHPTNKPPTETIHPTMNPPTETINTSETTHFPIMQPIHQPSSLPYTNDMVLLMKQHLELIKTFVNSQKTI